MTDWAHGGQCPVVGQPLPDARSTPTWEQVYEEHADFVLRCARQMGVPPQYAEDIVHDVFLVVHARLHTFDPSRASLKSWLYGILRRVFSHWRRGRGRAERRLSLVPPAPPPVSMEDEFSRKEAVDLLERFIASLDDKKRMVFTLSEVEGLSAPEVAACLELNVNTVYSRVRAARRAFADFIAQETSR